MVSQAKRNLGIHRTVCGTLAEMRACYETRNFSYLPGLIEEAQHLANRMEAGLQYQKGIREMHDELKELRKEKAKLLTEIKEIK